MRKKVLTCIGVIAVLAVVLSLTAFAESAEVELTDYNLINVIRQSLEMAINAIFKIADTLYIYFTGLFG